MSWEHTTYEAHCEDCGAKGFCISSSDNWGRSETSWEGFKSEKPDATSVIRQRVSARDMVPVCKCGSRRIKVGKELGARDGRGNLSRVRRVRKQSAKKRK
ncbi:MAG TPA: hypothetical protein VMF08_08920 [Candidatus Sulfotelmatobacter sp.]|nr:hypothetical protein [Candidatus Sulfotelmatobacter sp.]